MAESIRVAIHASFSTGMQNPKSTEGQEREGRKRAEREGWTPAQMLHDTALSGAIMPASCSLIIPIICASIKRLFRMCLLLKDWADSTLQ